jgi:hypothetical protein
LIQQTIQSGDAESVFPLTRVMALPIWCEHYPANDLQ